MTDLGHWVASPRMYSRSSWASAVTLGTALVLVGCSDAERGPDNRSGPPTQEQMNLDWAFEEVTGVALPDARDALGMSEDTYDIYLEVRDRGYVLASDVLKVMPEFVACVEDVGFEVVHDPSNEGFFGLPDIGWGIYTPPGSLTTPAEDDLILACSDRTIGALELFYYNQPSSPEREDAWQNDGRREAAADCLEDAGLFVRDDAPMQEFIDITKELSDETTDSTCLDLVLYGAST